MNLFINYFDHLNPERKKEIEFCYTQNLKNIFFENIIIVNRNRRATFGDFFEVMNDYPNDVNVIANLDIYFDETIQQAKNINFNECYALTRWEHLNGRIVLFEHKHGRRVPAQWSQDAWIFRGSPSSNGFQEVLAVNLDTKKSEMIPFELGIPGCDNKIAALLKEKRYNVKNPSFDIRAIHVHKEDKRIYPRYQILQGIRPNGLVYQGKL